MKDSEPKETKPTTKRISNWPHIGGEGDRTKTVNLDTLLQMGDPLTIDAQQRVERERGGKVERPTRR